jgi:hypothetical protein
VLLSLKTPDWLQQAQHEMALCMDNTQALCDLQPIPGVTDTMEQLGKCHFFLNVSPVANSCQWLFADVEIPPLAGLACDSPTDFEEHKAPPTRPAPPSKAPSRPPLPKSPQASPQHVRKVNTIIIIDFFLYVNTKYELNAVGVADLKHACIGTLFECFEKLEKGRLIYFQTCKLNALHSFSP